AGHAVAGAARRAARTRHLQRRHHRRRPERAWPGRLFRPGAARRARRARARRRTGSRILLNLHAPPPGGGNRLKTRLTAGFFIECFEILRFLLANDFIKKSWLPNADIQIYSNTQALTTATGLS